MRDPRLDPQWRDRMRANGKTRAVALLTHARTGDRVLYYIEENPQRPLKRCLISTWYDWCSRNKAVEVKDGPG